MIKIFADGGTIMAQPSTIGGAWTYIHVEDEQMVAMGSGLILLPGQRITPEVDSFAVHFKEYEMFGHSKRQRTKVSADFMETLALYMGLKNCNDHNVWLHSDNQCAIHRFCGSYSWASIPNWLVERARIQIEQKHMCHTLLAGHPTRVDLENGWLEKKLKSGVKRYPVSRWQVACDMECNRLKNLYLDSL